jgi:hypothetical protein
MPTDFTQLKLSYIVADLTQVRYAQLMSEPYSQVNSSHLKYQLKLKFLAAGLKAYSSPEVGEVTVTKLLRYATSYFFKYE